MSATTATSVFDFEAVGIEGRSIGLAAYRGQVLLIVNVASRCGYTPQYAGLESLYRRHRAAGFVVLGFPCNQFGRQEPGGSDDIKAFCAERYDVTFPLFGKVDVNGPHAHPLFRFLRASKKGWLGSDTIKWNFTKFLVNREGRPVKRYGSTITPSAIEPDILRMLAS
jgi:glutathione peroxidase